MTTLSLLSSMAPRAYLAAAIDLFHQSHPIRIDAQAGGGVDVARRVEAGEPVDLVVLSNDAIDKLIASGHVARGARTDLIASHIAVAVKSASSAPDLSSESSLRDAVRTAPSLSYSTGPSGRYLESLFARWGILDEIRPRIVVPPPGTPVANLVAAGRAALGFQQLSELLDVPGIDVIDALPAEIQQVTIFTGSVTARSKAADAGREVLQYLASERHEGLRERLGMRRP